MEDFCFCTGAGQASGPLVSATSLNSSVSRAKKYIAWAMAYIWG